MIGFVTSVPTLAMCPSDKANHTVLIYSMILYVEYIATVALCLLLILLDF